MKPNRRSSKPLAKNSRPISPNMWLDKDTVVMTYTATQDATCEGKKQGGKGFATSIWLTPVANADSLRDNPASHFCFSTSTDSNSLTIGSGTRLETFFFKSRKQRDRVCAGRMSCQRRSRTFGPEPFPFPFCVVCPNSEASHYHLGAYAVVYGRF
jgi:hypothetical protein